MLDKKGLVYEQNKEYSYPTPKKITKWEGQTREQKRHQGGACHFLLTDYQITTTARTNELNCSIILAVLLFLTK